MPRFPILSLALVMAGAAQPTGSAAQAAPAPSSGRLTVELNKFEAGEGDSCRAFFLFRNGTGKSFSGFQMSLAILDTGGIIDQLLSIDAAPLPAARTTLKLFEIPGIACDAISQVLLHDIPVCQFQNEDATDCFPLVDLTSRTAADLVK